MAWSVRLESIAKAAITDAGKLKTDMAACWKILDQLNERVALMESTLSVHSSLLKPENLAQHHTETTEFRVSTQKDIAALQAHVSAMMAKTKI